MLQVWWVYSSALTFERNARWTKHPTHTRLTFHQFGSTLNLRTPTAARDGTPPSTLWWSRFVHRDQQCLPVGEVQVDALRGRLRDATVLELVRNRSDLYRDATADLTPDTAVHILAPGDLLSL
jgi:hypothetical protein